MQKQWSVVLARKKHCFCIVILIVTNILHTEMEIPMTKMVLMATAFSKNSMMGMVIVALVCMGIPFIALAYMKTKTGAKITSFLKGLLFYALFAFGVSGLINILLLGGLSLSSVCQNGR